MSKGRVFILGAGCSYDGEHGYPLANQFIQVLERYAETIEGRQDCLRIKKAVDDTVALLKQAGSSSWYAGTIDQLIDLILKAKCDDQLRNLPSASSSHVVGLRYEAVGKAKIATAACFLSLEKKARERQLAKYRQFIAGKVLNEVGTSSYCLQRLRKSSARVLSFNYDRLFELAFFASFADESTSRYGPYTNEVLNSGLTAFGDLMVIDPDQFCFLKLHGSIGVRCADDAFGQRLINNDNIDSWSETKVNDALYFRNVPSPIAEPLIAFPFEKDFIISGQQNAYAFREYIKQVWDHATLVLKDASEIWVIGYSFDPTDCAHLLSRIHQAHECERIVIQNHPAECDRIAALLKIEHRLRMPIETYPVQF
jgi:hypothetical protein